MRGSDILMKPTPGTILTHPKNESQIILTHLLGEGGFGQVWKGVISNLGKLSKEKYNNAIGKTVAVKLALRSPEYIRVEYNMLKKLNKVEGVVPLLTHFSNQKEYLVQPFIEKTLYDYFQENGNKLSIKATLGIGACLVHTLKEMHRKGIVHQDIKAENIMLTGDPERSCNNIVFIDFGGACNRKASRNSKNPCNSIGTSLYKSLRQHDEGGAPTYRDDLEILCYTLLELVLGELPWYQSAREMSRRSRSRVIADEKRNFGERDLVELLGARGAMPFALLLREGRIRSNSLPPYDEIIVAFIEAQVSVGVRPHSGVGVGRKRRARTK